MKTFKEALDKITETVNGRDLNNFKDRVPPIRFNLIKDGVEIHEFNLSVQASEYHYSEPRENADEYSHVEIGFPNFKFSQEFIDKYAEDCSEPLDTVYPYVPIEELAEELYLFCHNFK